MTKINYTNKLSINGCYQVVCYSATNNDFCGISVNIKYFHSNCIWSVLTNKRTHAFNGLFSRTTWVSQHQKGKPFLILLKQEMRGGSGISWTICTTLQTDNHASTHHSIFLRAGCSSWRPTNSVKALKAVAMTKKVTNLVCHIINRWWNCIDTQ